MRDSSTQIGKDAERVACLYLQKKGFKILDQNWKNRYCEIDIVATKDERVYFVEVKYRRSDKWGEGLEYITATKLRQMQFAASNWVQVNSFNGDYNLSAIAVSNSGVQDFIEEILL